MYLIKLISIWVLSASTWEKSGFNVSSTVEEEFKSYFIPSPISLLVFPYSIGLSNDTFLSPVELADKYGSNSVFLLNSTSLIFLARHSIYGVAMYQGFSWLI